MDSKTKNYQLRLIFQDGTERQAKSTVIAPTFTLNTTGLDNGCGEVIFLCTGEINGNGEYIYRQAVE